MDTTGSSATADMSALVSAPIVTTPEPRRAWQEESVSFRFHGSGGAYFVLMLKNVFFTLLTVGIYAAWAKTALRKWVWQNLEIGGQRLGYHGTGKELFMGYLRVAVVAVGVAGVIFAASLISEIASAVAMVGLYVGLFVATPYAIYGGRRYLLSRTSWRGIRFGLEQAGAAEFRSTFWKGALLSVVTLGLYYPFFANRLYAVMTNNSALGSEKFRYDGTDAEAFRLFLKGIFLSVVTLGIYSFWYQAEMARFRVGHTHFSGATGRLTLTGGQILILNLGMVLGLMLSAGLAMPWLLCWNIRYTLEHMTFDGPIDYAAVEQRAAAGDAAADGFADAMDVGLQI